MSKDGAVHALMSNRTAWLWHEQLACWMCLADPAFAASPFTSLLPLNLASQGDSLACCKLHDMHDMFWRVTCKLKHCLDLLYCLKCLWTHCSTYEIREKLEIRCGTKCSALAPSWSVPWNRWSGSHSTASGHQWAGLAWCCPTHLLRRPQEWSWASSGTLGSQYGSRPGSTITSWI